MDELIRRKDAIEAIKALECLGYIECKTVGTIKEIEAIPSADRPKEKTISVDVLREILSDVKEAHRNNYEAEAVIADVWGEVVDMLKGKADEKMDVLQPM